jgi:predicted GIY-YIG superfamily endonuclease
MFIRIYNTYYNINFCWDLFFLEINEKRKEKKRKLKDKNKIINKNMFYVYLLLCTDNRNTYVGATMDINRRLRQHNGEIKGGAKATTSKVGKGEKWRRVCYVSGFPDWSSALQFEWRWKQISRKIFIKNQKPLEKRMEALNILLSLDKSTTKAIPFIEWVNPPQIHLDEPVFPTILATIDIFV